MQTRLSVSVAVVMLFASAGCFPDLPPSANDTAGETDGETADGATSADVMRDSAEVEGDALYASPTPPANVSASADFEDRIVLTWSAVEGAIAYEVYRDGSVLARVEGGHTVRYEDRSAALAVSNGWEAATDLSASTTDPDVVTLAWTAPARPTGPVAAYVVVAMGADERASEPSERAEGRRVGPPIVAWDIERVEGDASAEISDYQGIDPTWTDLAAPPPVIMIPTPTATDEAHRSLVSLDVAPEVVTRTAVRYRVRGRLEGGGVTPWSEPAEGWRADGVASAAWERADAPEGPWQALSDSAARSYSDETAPADGSVRFYRRRVELEGGSEGFSEPASGRRLAFNDVTVAWKHACALSAGGRVWCWGTNSDGELGRPVGSESMLFPTQVENLESVASIAAGLFATGFGSRGFTCARTVEGAVVCWGFAPGTTGTSAPAPILGAEDVQTLAVGISQACVTTGDRVRCWGAFLGNSVSSGSSEPVDIEVLAQATGNPVPLAGFGQLASGGGLGGCATYATSSSKLRCWPGPEQVAATFEVGVSVSALWRGGTSSHRCVITTTGSVRCWGDGSSGQLGQGEKVSSEAPLTVLGLEDSPVVEVSVGWTHTCARQLSGTVRCWGGGAFGQLGHGQSGDGVEALRPVNVVDSSGMTHVTTGYESTCAINEHQVYCWGNNDFGQLGVGDTTLRNTPTPIITP